MIAATALVIGLVASGQAFLLPPSISKVDTDAINALPFEVAGHIGGNVLNLECAGCPVASTDASGNNIWVQGVESELKLDFSINGNKEQSLSLNGVQIYPPNDLSIDILHAPQVTSDNVVEMRLGYEMSIKPVAKSKDDSIEIIAINLQIVEVGDQFVNELDNVELNLFRTGSGKLMIANLQPTPTMNPIVNPSEDGKQCSTLICKWRAIVANKFSGLKPKKGCGSKAHGSKAHPKKQGKGGNHNKHHGSSHSQSGPHRHHHKHHGVARFFFAVQRIAMHVIVPIFIGLAVGMTASLIGMVVGNLVVFIWRAFYRRGQKGVYSKIQQEGIEQEVKAVQNNGPPPVYEAVVDEKVAQ